MPGLQAELRRRNTASILITFDPTSNTAQDTGKSLPKGAIPLGVESLGGGTGGTTPLGDVGTSGDDNGFADDLVVDSHTATKIGGALLTVELTAATADRTGCLDLDDVALLSAAEKLRSCFGECRFQLGARPRLPNGTRTSCTRRPL